MQPRFVAIRHFSLSEANALVPRLSATFDRARVLQRRMEPIAKELAQLGHPAELASAADSLVVDEQAPERVQKLQGDLRARLGELRALLEDLAQLGLEIKAVDGLVDFRSKLRGKTVCLCWRFGEKRVSQWHNLETGFAGRQSIKDGDEFEGELLH